MKCEVISIGDELLIGQTVNTNATWIGEKLNNFGFTMAYGAVISDNKDDIISSEAISNAIAAGILKNKLNSKALF